MTIKTKAYEHRPQFNVFHDMMKFRVREILLVSSLYDAFVLEEDGRLSEKILGEYVDLNLRFIPRITRVSTAQGAFDALEKKTYDMVLTMTRIADMNPIAFGHKIKEIKSDMPVIILTYEFLDDETLESIETAGCIDKVFYWSGDTKIMLAVIKFVEDMKNVERDIALGVRVILMIEDSPRFYSLFLPIVYTAIMTQSRMLISQGVNDLHRLLRMRARPKILMAGTYEQGMQIYEKYKKKLLGVISDIRFPRNGELDGSAGLKFASKIREELPDLPILLQSSEINNREIAYNEGLGFLHKRSENLLRELNSFILSDFGFGDFVFRMPDGAEIDRAKNLQEFCRVIQSIPDESLRYHVSHNHISMWLRARTEFQVADEIRAKKLSDFGNMEEIRQYIKSCIQKVIHQNRFGVITDFEQTQFESEYSFIKLGEGSLGGKARSIAFLNALLTKLNLGEEFDKVEIKTPHTFVICSEVFEEFIEKNELLSFAIEERNNGKIAKKFLQGRLPSRIMRDLRTLLENVNYPLAVRSSSILEDSQRLPFAGLYSTYMLPNNHSRFKSRLKQLCRAIKLVFASIFYKSPKEYVKNSFFRIEEEKMAVIIQQIVGRNYGDYYYPAISGVAQSYNFYPISHMEPSDGIVHLALGLGTIIVDGEQNLFKFSPEYPEMNPPFSSAGEFLKNSQNYFYALDFSGLNKAINDDEKYSLKKLDLGEAEKHDALFYVASTYSAQDDAIRDTISIPGPRVLTFAPILKYRLLPIAGILKTLLRIIHHAFGSHVEIEFAINLFREADKRAEFCLLQARPMVAGEENVEVSLKSVNDERVICKSEHSMGNGVFKGLCDIVYVDPDTFDLANTRAIANEVGQLNRHFIKNGGHYILIGFGRWGTSDPWLGIPVDWFQISKAKVIIESNLEDKLNVAPSQGTHFFHNMLSLKLGYFHIKKTTDSEFILWNWIKSRPVANETKFVKHIHFEKPAIVKIDGRVSNGVLLKP